LHQESLDDTGYRGYIAALVVSDSIIVDGDCNDMGDASEMFRMIRPDGGVAIIGQPGGCPNVLNPVDLQNWLDAGNPAGSQISYQITDDSNGVWARLDRGPLPGAGEWTGVWGDLGNTACSGDTRITDTLKPLWFGKPGPRVMPIDRHWRPMPSLYKAGRLIVPAQDKVICSDAYNGARMWEIDVPDSTRVAILRDTGWVTLDEDYVYIASKNQCQKVDLDSGDVLTTYTIATADRDWGYVAVDGDLLFGSEQIEDASVMSTTSIAPYRNDVSRNDWHDIITSKKLFCRNRNSDSGDARIWEYDNSSVIANPTICIDGDYIYFFESIYPAAVSDPDGGVQLQNGGTPIFIWGSNEYLVKLNKNTGDVQWRVQKNVAFYHMIYLSCADGILLASGSIGSYNSGYSYNLYAYRTSDGGLVWSKNFSSSGGQNGRHGEQDKHPMIVNGTIRMLQGSWS
ncbi:MAG: PQQ-binding-like beta-propeller repeat protein, partial [Gammaproteobacteria bacterium]|nr:PQQ-binding-like beta-propeller repeat protein [Gammaproteobacteria bacterium]